MSKAVAALVAVCGLWLARAAPAQDVKSPPAKDGKAAPTPVAPDLDFLEYLGAWQENDEEWLVSQQWQKNGAGRKRGAESADGKKPDEARNDGDEGK